MNRQDPTFRPHGNPETGQTLINGMGELHLEVIKPTASSATTSSTSASTSRASATANRSRRPSK